MAWQTDFLVNISRISSEKSLENIPKKLNRLYSEVARHFPYEDFQDGLSGCWLSENKPEDDEPLFGFQSPDELIWKAKKIKEETIEYANELIRKLPLYNMKVSELLNSEATNNDTSPNLALVRIAIGMAGNCPNVLCPYLVYSSAYREFHAYPTQLDINSIEAKPQEWAILPVTLND